GLGSAVVGDGPVKTARTLNDDGADGYLAADGTEVLSPLPTAVPGPTPLPDSVKAGYCNLLDKAHAHQVQHFELQKARYEKATAEQRNGNRARRNRPNQSIIPLPIDTARYWPRTTRSMRPR